MKRRFKKWCITTLVMFVIGSVCTCTVSAETAESRKLIHNPATVSIDLRASEQLNSYAVSLSNQGTGRMRATFSVLGTGTMDTIGVQKIVIEEESNGGSWRAVYTFTDYYASNSVFYSSYVEFGVTPGMSYRATITAYAKNAKGSDTGSVTSGVIQSKQ